MRPRWLQKEIVPRGWFAGEKDELFYVALLLVPFLALCGYLHFLA